MSGLSGLSELFEPVSLSAGLAKLEPLAAAHLKGLQLAAEDGQQWRLWYTAVPRPEAMGTEIARRLALHASGQMLPFTVFDANGQVVGMTTFMNIDNLHRRVEIGSTWYGAGAQRTGLNTECKLLLLRHAFDTLGCIAVEFRTHRLNSASRRAIERIGAQLDGVLRSHQRSADGTLRDTAVYSITAAEWPTIQTHLQWLLQKPRKTT
jgi:RimJ/RimL family protein N-acetyltransferase